MSITSTGLGTGLKINDIVKSIVDAEKDPVIKDLTEKNAKATAKITAYGLLNSELSNFKDSYKELSKPSTFAAAKATSSDEDILTAKLGIGAETGNWDFEVKQKAQAHSIVTSAANALPSVNSPIGTGTATIRFGTYDYNADGSIDKFNVNADKASESIVIDNSINSISGLRDAINTGYVSGQDKDGKDIIKPYSFTASIVDDGENYRLVLTSKATGEQNALEITVEDSDGNNTDTEGLSRLAFGETTSNCEETSKAQDAKITMNGMMISRDTNEISNVIQGVTLNINSVTELNKTVSLKIEPDKSQVEEKLKAFIESYNSTITKMNDLTKFVGPKDSSNGILCNDKSVVRNIKSMMREVLNTQLDRPGEAVQSFADLGILTNRTDGTLEIDTKIDPKKFENVLKDHMDSVAKFFTASGNATDSFITYDSKNSLTKPGVYDIEVTQIATKASLTGDTALVFPLDVTDLNDSFKVNLNGTDSDLISLSQKSYENFEDLIAEIQSKVNSDPQLSKEGISLKVANDGGKISFTSNIFGRESKVSIMDAEPGLLDSLGLNSPVNVVGVDVIGTIDGEVAKGNGQYLLSTKGDSAGISVLVEGGDVSNPKRGSVTYTSGLASMMTDLLTNIIDNKISPSDQDRETSGGIIDTTIDSLYKSQLEYADKEKRLIFRTDKMEKRLFKEFNAMDAAVGALNNTMSYLKASLDALPGYTRKK